MPSYTHLFTFVESYRFHDTHIATHVEMEVVVFRADSKELFTLCTFMDPIIMFSNKKSQLTKHKLIYFQDLCWVIKLFMGDTISEGVLVWTLVHFPQGRSEHTDTLWCDPNNHLRLVRGGGRYLSSIRPYFSVYYSTLSLTTPIARCTLHSGIWQSKHL